MGEPGFSLSAFWALRDDRTLSGAEWKVAVALVMHANEHGRARPSVRRLAAVSRTSPGAVRRALTRLEGTTGPLRLSVERGQSEHGDAAPNNYIISLEGWDQQTPTPDQESPTGDQQAPTVGSPVPQGWVSSDPRGGIKGAPEEDLTRGSNKRTSKSESAERSKPARPKVSKWTKVPEDWQPDAEHKQVAIEEGVDFELQLKKFRDHEFKTPKSDADAAFRNWLRSPYAKTKGNGRAHEPQRSPKLAAIIAGASRPAAAGGAR